MSGRRVWAGVGVALALAAGVGLWLAPRGPEPTPPAAAPGTDWISAVARVAPEGFDRLDGPWALDLPADHGRHAEAPTEVWQLSAHLEDAEGNPVGVQFLIFRVALAGPKAPAPASSLEARELYRGHVVLVGPDGDAAVAQERFGRGLEGLAGFDAAIGELRLDAWALEFPTPANPDRWRLTTGPGDLRLDLTLTLDKDPIAVDGDATPFRGYAFSRLRAEGSVATEAGPRSVSGVAWYEHLWGDLPIPGGSPVASDRLQVQLDDGSELSLVRSRRIDGVGIPTVDAVVIDAQGTATAFDEAATELEALRSWQGAAAAWPVDWRLRLGDLQLDITPVIDAQEHAFMLSVWSGLVRAEGQRGDRPVSGVGTLQLSADRR